MAVLRVFSQSYKIHYKTTLCSTGFIFSSLSLLILVVAPFFIAYRTQGFWMLTDSYLEQPEIHYKNQAVIVLYTNAGLISWSTFSKFNDLMSSTVRAPDIMYIEEDQDHDGKKDMLQLNMEMPLHENETVTDIKLFLVFDYRLYRYTRLRMDGLAYVTHSSLQPGSEFSSFGELRFRQSHPLPNRATDERFKDSIFANDDFSLRNLVENYAFRDVRTEYVSSFPGWEAGPTGRFSVRLRVAYPLETVQVVPGVWLLLKWAWVQYVAIFLPVLVLLRRLREYVFTNCLVSGFADTSELTKALHRSTRHSGF